jgi:hypothetical protein
VWDGVCRGLGPVAVCEGGDIEVIELEAVVTGEGEGGETGACALLWETTIVGGAVVARGSSGCPDEGDQTGIHWISGPVEVRERQVSTRPRDGFHNPLCRPSCSAPWDTCPRVKPLPSTPPRVPASLWCRRRSPSRSAPRTTSCSHAA